MATASTTESTTDTTTVLVQDTKEKEPETPTLRLNLPKNEKKVQWGEEVIDNEGMGKKSSKCCCVYKKPRVFGESSSEDDSEEENEDKCKGPKAYHKKAKQKKHDHEHDDCNACS